MSLVNEQQLDNEREQRKKRRPGKCEFCGGKIDAERDYQRVEGWVSKRASGGANTIALREPVADRWACVVCIGELKAGRSPQQGGLL